VLARPYFALSIPPTPLSSSPQPCVAQQHTGAGWNLRDTGAELTLMETPLATEVLPYLQVGGAHLGTNGEKWGEEGADSPLDNCLSARVTRVLVPMLVDGRRCAVERAHGHALPHGPDGLGSDGTPARAHLRHPVQVIHWASDPPLGA